MDGLEDDISFWVPAYFQVLQVCYFQGGLYIQSGQIIATSHDLTPNGGEK